MRKYIRDLVRQRRESIQGQNEEMYRQFCNSPEGQLREREKQLMRRIDGED